MNKIKECRGRLAQWKNTRFVIFRPRGPRFDPRRGNLFRRDNINSHVCLTVTQQSDGYFQSRNLESKKAVATTTLYGEEM